MADLAAISAPKRGPSTEVTERLSEILEDYLRWHRIEGHTPATISHYRRELGRFLKWLASQCHTMAPGDLTRRDIMAHLEAMQDRGLAPKSLDTQFRDIRAWCHWMLDWDLILTDPTAKLKPPKVLRVSKPFVKKHEFQAMLDICPLSTLLGARRQAMLWLLSTSGIRRNEMFMLRVGDVDWEQEFIRVMHGKGQKERVIEFHPAAQLPMLRYIQHRKLKGFDSEWLWVTKEGVRLMWHGIGQDMKRLQERAGVKIPDPCHAFRRTYPAEAMRQGISDAYIRKNLGWTTNQMLVKYTSSMEQEPEAREALRRFRPFGGT